MPAGGTVVVVVDVVAGSGEVRVLSELEQPFIARRSPMMTINEAGTDLRMLYLLEVERLSELGIMGKDRNYFSIFT